MECLKRGDLTKHIDSWPQQETTQDISKLTLEGLKVMRQKGIAHRDTKASDASYHQTPLDYAASPKYWHIHTRCCSLDVSCLDQIRRFRNIEMGPGLTCYLLLLDVSSQLQHSRGPVVGLK